MAVNGPEVKKAVFAPYFVHCRSLGKVCSNLELLAKCRWVRFSDRPERLYLELDQSAQKSVLQGDQACEMALKELVFALHQKDKTAESFRMSSKPGYAEITCDALVKLLTDGGVGVSSEVGAKAKSSLIAQL